MTRPPASAAASVLFWIIRQRLHRLWARVFICPFRGHDWSDYYQGRAWCQRCDKVKGGLP